MTQEKSKPLRIAFMGTPDFAVAALQELLDSPHDIACVYTQPPRPKGRGKKVQSSPVHQLADAHNIEVRHPCLLYTSPSPRDRQKSRMPSSA